MSSLRSRSGGKSMTATFVEQVLSELTLFHQFDQIRLAGDDNAEIDRYRIVGPQPFNLSLLQDPLDLHCRRHAFDLVEKEGAAMRVLLRAE